MSEFRCTQIILEVSYKAVGRKTPYACIFNCAKETSFSMLSLVSHPYPMKYPGFTLGKPIGSGLKAILCLATLYCFVMHHNTVDTGV